MSRLQGHWLAQPWGRQRVWEAGDGRPVLAIHGLGGSGRYFERLAARAPGRFRLIAPDLAGFGASDKPDIPYDREGHLESIDAVVRGVDEPLVIVGHSLGGVFAALWTARDPSRVAASAILCAPFPTVDRGRVWVQEPHLPRAARVATPALRTIVRVLSVPVGVARGFPVTIAAARILDRAGHRVGSATMEPDTPALRALDGSDLDFEVTRTERARSAEESARFQGIGLGQLLRTIVVRRGEGDYVFVLVPGGRQIDWPKLRAHLGVSRLSLPDADEARTASGYERGTITPFGSAHAWPVIADASIPRLERVAIGGGGHGVNLHLRGADLVNHLAAEVSDVTKLDDG